MTATLQVLYPVGSDTRFDHGYYATEHMALVQEHMGSQIEQTVVVKGLAGGPDTPPGFHAIATIVFKSAEAMQTAMAAAAPVMADIPNFTNVRPVTLIGETY